MDLVRIGKNIQHFRRKAGYTQAELAEKVGVTNTHISHLETGDGTMSLDSLVDIASALSTTPDYLLFGNMKFTPNRISELFIEKIKDFTQEEVDYIFDMIDVVNQYRITRK